MKSPGARVDPRIGRPQSARVYDYWLGGKDNYAVDRQAGDAVIGQLPHIGAICRANRAFMRRAAAFVAGAGIDQFLDVGTGIPTEPNLHQVAQAANPAARVVYVDNDPIVLAHAGALMTSHPAGATAYLRADAREPTAILQSPQLTAVIDLSRPVGLTAFGLLHFLDDDQARLLVTTMLGAMAPGSYVAFAHATLDFDVDGTARRAMDSYTAAGMAMHMRDSATIGRLFLDGLEVVQPGLVVVERWRPIDGQTTDVRDADVSNYGVVARTPLGSS